MENVENEDFYKILDELGENVPTNENINFDFRNINLDFLNENNLTQTIRTNENNVVNSPQLSSNEAENQNTTQQLPTFQKTFAPLQNQFVNQCNEQQTVLYQATTLTESQFQKIENIVEPSILQFAKQPMKKFDFSYPATPNYIKAEDKSYPIITYETSNLQNSDLYLHVDIFEEKQNGSKQFSPHSLINNNKELTTKPTFRELSTYRFNGKRKVYSFNLDKFYIVQTKKNIEQIFQNKDRDFDEMIGKNYIYQIREKSENYAIMLGCQVFEKNGKFWNAVTERIYSKEMYPLLNINIQKRFFTENSEIVVNLEHWTLPENVQVELKCKEFPEKHSNWYKLLQIRRTNENNLKFLMPKCDAQIFDNVSEINCYLQAKNTTVNFYTKRIKFTYELPKPTRKRQYGILVYNNNENTNILPSTTQPPKVKIFKDSYKPVTELKKQKEVLRPDINLRNKVIKNLEEIKQLEEINSRAFESLNFDSCKPVTELKKQKEEEEVKHSDINLLNKAIKDLEAIKKLGEITSREVFESLNFEFSEQNEHENSIIHAAIEHEKYLFVYRIIKENQLMDLVPTLRNKYGETPLHYACKLQKECFVISLCKLGYPIFLQDDQKQTPLHIAINESANCLEAFQKLMLDDDYTTKELRLAFRWLLQIYNLDGLSILHLAVIKQRYDFLESILKFCQNEKINACDFETLYTSETIFDLAKETEIYNLILKYYPNAKEHTNYADPKSEDYDDEDLIINFKDIVLKD